MHISSRYGLGNVNSQQNAISLIRKIFYSKKIERRVSEESENFLSSYGEYSISKTGEMFCALSVKAKEKVLPYLSYHQKLFVWFGAQGIEIPIFTILCNGNENLARMYRNEPINKVLNAYAHAKKYPKCEKMHMQHFMALTKEQIRVFHKVFSQSTILPSDQIVFTDALEILKKIEPEFDGRIITDGIKLYPSLKEQALLFWKVPLPFNSYKCKVLAGALIGLDQAMISYVKFLGVKFYPSLSITSMMFLLSGLSLCLDFIYKHYHSNMDIRNNILPNRPTLTGGDSKMYNIWQ